MSLSEDIKRNVWFYLLSQGYTWKQFFASYRAQAVSWTIVQGISTLAPLISLSVIYSVSSGLPGWTYFQLLVLASLAQITGGILWYMIGPRQLVSSMRGGGLDQMLLKPYNPILVIFARFGGASSIGTVMSGALLLAYALANAHAEIYALLAFIPLYIAGVSVFVMAVLTITLASYILIEDASYISWVLNIVQSASQYPVSIYGLLGATLLSVLVPISFATYFPAAVLFGKMSYAYVLPAALAAALAAVALYFASSRLLKRYKSGGG